MRPYHLPAADVRRQTSLGLALASALALSGCGSGKSDRDEGLMAEDGPPDCAPGKEELFRSKVTTAVNKIRVARSRADMALMDANELILGTLENCPAFHEVCDTACAVERASVHLFRASAIPLLSSKPTTSLCPKEGRAAQVCTTEETMLKQARRGIEIADEALTRLPRQRGFHAGTDDSDKQGNGGYNAYLKMYAAVQGLRAELQMAAGDIFYRRASTARAVALNYFVADVLGDSRGTAARDDGDLALASVYYEEAYWILLDARTSLPADLAASPLFSGELTHLYGLTDQVGERVRSLREGKLYIGIDPSGLSDASAAGGNLGQLSAYLYQQRDELAKVEGDLEQDMREWAQKSEQLQRDKDELAETMSSRAIDLEVHKIQQINESTDGLKEPIERAIQKLDRNLSVLELEAQINAVSLQFEVSRRQFEQELRLLEDEQKEDLIQTEQEIARLDLDKVTGAIDATLSEFNFEMQREALKQQGEDIAQSQAQEAKNMDAIGQQVVQLRRDNDRQTLEIARLNQEKQKIATMRNAIIVDRIASLRAQKDAVQADIGFFTQNTGLIDQICSARQTLSTTQQADLKRVADCLQSGCPTGPSVAAAWKALTTKKQEKHAVMLTMANQVRDKLNARVRDAQSAIAKWKSSIDPKVIATEVAYAVAAVAAAVPDGDTGWAGIGPVKTFRIFEAIADGLKVTAEGLQMMVQFESERINFMQSAGSEILQAEGELARIAADLRTADIDKELAKLEEEQALAELDVRYLEITKELGMSKNETVIQQVECRQSAGQNVASLARLRAESVSIDAQIRAQNGERETLDVENKQQDNLIQQAQASIARNNAEIDELQIRLEQAQGQIAHFGRMRDSVNRQLRYVADYQGIVNTLVGQKEQIERRLREHVDKISLVRTQANAAQRAFVHAAIKDAEKVAFEAIEALKTQVAANREIIALGEELRQIEASARALVKQHRDELTRLLSARPIPGATDLIWDLEEVSAQLTKGAGELLDYKRSLLASMNYYYNSYRYRYNLLSEFVGRGGIPEDEPYIWTSADVTQKLSRCATLSSPLCTASSLVNERSAVPITHATFLIDKNSAMFQELVRTRKTHFEFAKFARNKAESHNLGDYVLWDEDSMDDGEMRVLGFYLAFPQLSCTPTLMQIRHTGLGYQVSDETGVGNLEMRSPIQERPSIFTMASGIEKPENEVTRRVATLATDSLSIAQLEERLSGPEAQGLMPFVGYPLRGLYELTTDDPQSCLRKVNEMQLTVVFAKKSRRPGS